MVSFIVSKAFDTPLSNLKKILSNITKNLYVITGNTEGFSCNKNEKNITVNEITFKKNNNKIIQAIKYLFLQIKISLEVIKLSKNTDCYIFFMEGVGILPMLTVKLTRKKIIWMIPSSILLKCIDKKSINVLFNASQQISAILSNKIIVYSPNLIKEWKLDKFRYKIRIAHEHFLDLHKFNIKKKLEKRKKIIGHIGRLSKEKGSFNFIESIPNVLKKENNIKFLVGGDGDLLPKIENYLDSNKINGNAKLTGWISREDLPNCLNDLKLIVMPSYTEGLPNIMLESMACGTPVLATSVGGIPDIIKHNETGFILKENTPECIEKSIVDAMNNSNLDKIAQNARNLVKKEFTMENTIKKYKDILNEVLVK